ncbi:MAG: sigma-54 dependent transcriptional regulator [Bacteroidota bacterium]
MKKNGSILIVDDDEDVLYTARMVLKQQFSTVHTEHSTEHILDAVKQHHYDVVILDMNFSAGATSGKEGLDWLVKIKKADPQVQVIMNTAYGDIQLAVDSMKKGATDFLVKPWEKEKLLSTVNTVFALGQSNKKVSQLKDQQKVLSGDLDRQYSDMISSSAAMQRVLAAIEKVAQTDANVLILGENGTGKELVARAIYKQSLRSEEAFIKVDLGAVSETLFESELFGHKKGAFTDAKEDRAGRFEVANMGTLFLDEIGNLSMPLQSKLLSVLQNRQVLRVGANAPTDIDIRLICATNRPVYQMVDEGDFRQDLLYRINTVEIEIPPLRERIEDIPLLLDHYLGTYTKKYNKEGLKTNASTVKMLKKYDWPGNIRELQHAVERAVIMSSGKVLEPTDFLLSSKREKPATDAGSLKVEDMEKHTIQQALKKCEGNLTKAAVELGWGRSTLYRKMKKYGL